jgi:simple sugar transport system ATP-binding protein
MKTEDGKVLKNEQSEEPAMEPLLEMRNISKYFGGLCAVSRVNFSVGKGEVVGLVGDNAAGKSTLMKILAGAYSPSEGEIYFEGVRVRFHDPQDARGMGIEMLFQDLALVPELDVAENLFLGKEVSRRLFGKIPIKFLLDRKRMNSKAAEFLKDLCINVEDVHEKVRNLSGGQQQSVSIARTLFFNAKLVILDEPTSAISVRETQRVLELISQLKASSVSVIIVSHRMEDIFAVADRVVVLRRGSKVEDVVKGRTSTEQVIRKIIGADVPDTGACL